jgi:hypothetical protein
LKAIWRLKEYFDSNSRLHTYSRASYFLESGLSGVMQTLCAGVMQDVVQTLRQYIMKSKLDHGLRGGRSGSLCVCKSLNLHELIIFLPIDERDNIIFVGC